MLGRRGSQNAHALQAEMRNCRAACRNSLTVPYEVQQLPSLFIQANKNPGLKRLLRNGKPWWVCKLGCEDGGQGGKAERGHLRDTGPVEQATELTLYTCPRTKRRSFHTKRRSRYHMPALYKFREQLCLDSAKNSTHSKIKGRAEKPLPTAWI